MTQKDNSLYELEHAPVGSLLWKYSIPAIVGIVVMSLYNVVDRIFIGHIDGQMGDTLHGDIPAAELIDDSAIRF